MSITADRHAPSTRPALAPARGRGRDAVRRIAAHRGTREIGLLALLWIVYSASRLVAGDNMAAAQDRARSIVDVESWAHLDIEAWLNQAISPLTWVGVPMSYWYAVLHYVVTPAVLVFLFLRHRHAYPRARNALVIGSAIGLLAYVLIPTAPPRLIAGGGYLDTLATYASYGWWSDQASAPAGLGGLTNQLAAMPSLHVGWTVWVAWAIWRHTNLAGRTIACLYVVGTSFVVVATGNHWVLDTLAGAAVVAAGIWISGRVPGSAQGTSGVGT